jgi:S1-C subfamily serine protease
MKQATCRVYVHNRFAGTGCLIRDNLVLTAAHLFEGKEFPLATPPRGYPPAIQVLFVEPSTPTQQPSKIAAPLVLLNQEMDLAVLSIPQTGRTPVRLANHCAVDEKIMAPSFKHAQPLILPLGKIVEMRDEGIVYDASAGRGSSGGPIVNLNGELIGICAGPVERFKLMKAHYQTIRKWFAEMEKALGSIIGRNGG